MLFLHALLIFLFYTSAVALPGLPRHSAGIPDIRPNIPPKAKGRYCRFAGPDGTVSSIAFKPNLSISHSYHTASAEGTY